MKVKEAATLLEVSPSVVYALVAAGKLKHYRVGKGRGVIRIGEDHVREYLAGAEQGGGPPPSPPARPAPTQADRRDRLRHLGF